MAKLLPSGRHTCDRCDPEELTRTFARTMTRAFCLADLTTLASIHGSFDTDPAVLLLGTTRRFRCAPLLGNPPWQIKANELAIGQQGMQRIRALYEDMPVMTRETLRQLGGMVDDLAREVQGSLDGMPFGKIKLAQPLVNRSTGRGNSATKLVLLGPGIQIAPPHPTDRRRRCSSGPVDCRAVAASAILHQGDGDRSPNHAQLLLHVVQKTHRQDLPGQLGRCPNRWVPAKAPRRSAVLGGGWWGGACQPGSILFLRSPRPCRGVMAAHRLRA